MNRELIAERLITLAEALTAKKGEVPEAFKKQWKNKDKDGDGKENEPKPDFLKKKKAGTRLSEEDVLSFTVPLLIRIMEYSKEDAETDMDLHVATENMLRLGADGATLTMDDYDEIVGGESRD